MSRSFSAVTLLWVSLLLFTGFSISARAQTLSPNEQARVQKISESLLSPCCYGEPVSRHMSQVAFQIRSEIRERVLAGQSDRQILDYYKTRYGDQILVEPEGTSRTVLYTVPIVIAFAGFVIVFLFLRHSVMKMRTTQKSIPAQIPADSRHVQTIRKATDET